MNYAIILSGGVGTRMSQSGLPKQYVSVYGKPVLAYTMESFQRSPSIDRIVVVAHREWERDILAWVEQYGITKFCMVADGGDNRQESAFNGLLACQAFQPTQEDKVLIHDAARPMISVDLIEASIRELEKCDSCFAIVPMKDSIIMSEDGKTLTRWMDRSKLFHGQTPEGFHLLQYLQLNEEVGRENMKDVHGCNELSYQKGWKIGLVPGEDINFKLTTPADMERFFQIVEKRNAENKA